MQFENLPQVHTARHAERCQNDVNRAAVCRVRHVLLGKYARNNALVAVAAGKLVADGNRAQLCDLYMHALDDAGLELVALLRGKIL